MIQDRNDLPQFLSGIGVEVGVHEGYYSNRLLRDGHFRRLYSVDPWTPETVYWPCSTKSAEELYQLTQHTLAPYGDRSVILRKFSVEASHRFLPESLDFVYIDSSHLYHETCAELEAWWPKIIKNGLLAGHDYINGPEVKQAVDEFVARYGLQLETTVRDADFTALHVNSWLIRKPQ